MKTRIFVILTSILMLSAPASVAAPKKEKNKPKTEVKESTKKDSKSKKKGLFRRKKKGQATSKPDSTSTPRPDIERKGLFTVTKEKDDWFLQVPDSLLGRQFLVTVRYTSTPSGSGKFGGEQLNEQTVYFQQAPDKKLLLRSALIINVADTTEQINRAITVSNESPILGSFKVESHKNGMYRVKVTSFFNQDNAVFGLPQRVKQQYQLQGLLADMSYIEDIKSFPQNTEVRMVKTYASPQGNLPAARATGRVTFGLNASFVLLPKIPMQRRFFDPRVGYFTDRFTSYTDDQHRVEEKTFITRWRLEPRPEDVEKMRRGELVEPQKPIVFYIDPATPKQWRKYLIQGVDDWQVAFEKAGFKNAIMGKEWPEEDSTMSMEDARFSCIRYLASPIPNAYGPHVHDPRTGEILESHICWYHNVMDLVHSWYMVQASSIDEAARTMNFSEELMGQLIRFVSSHEVGHTLGLRHNFGSSSTVPVDSLRDKAWVEAHGHTPSIMDYARFNYVAQPEDDIGRKGIFPRINDYDLWAIQWGYAPMLDAKDEFEDHEMLEEMTLRSQENPRLWWGDGESYEGSMDPRRQTEDLGDDAMKASEYGILNLQYELNNLPSWTSDDKNDFYNKNLPKMYWEISTQFQRYCGHVARNIGGTLLTYRPLADSRPVAEPNPLDKQKRAFGFLAKHVLTEPLWLRDLPYAKRIDSDPQNLTLAVGRSVINTMMNRLESLNELYTPQAYLTDFSRELFSEARTMSKVSRYRQTLQNTMFTHLSRALNNGNTTVRPAVLYTLQQLQKQTLQASKNAADAETRAHWANLYDQIGRLLQWEK